MLINQELLFIFSTTFSNAEITEAFGPYEAVFSCHFYFILADCPEWFSYLLLLIATDRPTEKFLHLIGPFVSIFVSAICLFVCLFFDVYQIY